MAAAWLLAAPAAHAFTVENKDADGQYGVPKFDLEEQSKNFRKDGAGRYRERQRPLRDAARQRQAAVRHSARVGSANFGSVFCPGLGPRSRNPAAGLRPRLAPPTSLEYNGVR